MMAGADLAAALPLAAFAVPLESEGGRWRPRVGGGTKYLKSWWVRQGSNL